MPREKRERGVKKGNGFSQQKTKFLVVSLDGTLFAFLTNTGRTSRTKKQKATTLRVILLADFLVGTWNNRYY